MILDALNRIVELAHESAKPLALQLWPNDHQKILFDPVSKQLTLYDELPSPRRHAVETIDDLVAYASAWEESAGNLNRAACWLHPSGVTLILDDEAHRENRVVWSFVVSGPARALITAAEERTLFLPPALIRWLRLEIGLPQHTVIAAVRKVDWDIHNRTATQTDRAKSSLGKNIEAQISGAQDIPEHVTLGIHLYDGAVCPSSEVRCLVEIDPMQGMIGLIPPPGELDKHFEFALEHVRGQLAAGLPAAIPVYRGEVGAPQNQPR